MTDDDFLNFIPASLAEADAERARKDDEPLRRGDVLALLQRLEDDAANYALFGFDENARSREAHANALSTARCAVALLPCDPALITRLRSGGGA